MRTIILLTAWLSLSASALAQNLVAYYPFNGNANDQSGNNINPTYTGGTGVTLTTDRFGNANKAYNFDGATNSYMRMPSDLLPTANRTVSFWFNAASVSIRPVMLAYGGQGSLGYGTSFYMGLNVSGCGCYHTQAHYYTNAVSYSYSPDPVNQWIHWVVTINGSTTKMYVNGTMVANAPGSFTSNTYVTGRDLSIGVPVYHSGVAPYTDGNIGYFQGKLDDVRIYDAAMSDAQVQNLYANEAMVAYFPFNGNAVDETGNGNNSTYAGTGVTLTTDRFGNANKAYHFDGAVGSYIRVPADNFPTTDRTVSFWFNAERLDYYLPTPFSYGGSICNDNFITVLNHNQWPNTYTVIAHCATNRISAPYVTEPVNNWFHFTVTISGATQKIYINGVLKQTDNTFITPTYVTGTSALVGAMVNTDGNSVFAGYFQGKLDEFRIYNTAMTDAQVLALHTTETGTPPLAYYPFNGNANDQSGNGYNGTVSGALLGTDRFNQSGKAYNFVYNGFSSDKIQVPGTSSFNFSTGGFSLSSWVKFSGTAGAGYNYPIVSKHICSEQSGYILMLYNDKLTFWLAGAGGYNILTTPDNYTDGKWHQVVGVYDGTTQYIYVDGVLKNSAALTYAVFNTANLALGGYNGCNGGFNGKVDEIKVFDRPLTSGEINSLYKQSATDMVAYYPFNGNANDESGNGNNGIPVNGPTYLNDRFNVTGRAIQMNATPARYVTVSNNPSIQISNNLSISVWVKRNSLNTIDEIVNKGGDVNSGTCNYGLVFTPGELIFKYNGGYHLIHAPQDLNWHHYAITTYHGSPDVKFYTDGVYTPTWIPQGNINLNGASTADLYIGAMPATYYSNNIIDELRIYNRVLSPNEILQLADVPMQPGLLVYLPLNGNANDMSGNSHNGAVVNATPTTDKYDNTNSAFQFNGNGSGSSITLANSTLLDFLATPFTLSSWVKFSDATGEAKMILGKHNCGSATGYLIGAENNRFSYWLANGSSWSQVSTTETYNDNKWHHIVGAYDGSNQKLFVDGVFKAGTATTYNTPATGAPIKIGEPSGCGGLGLFNGSIDEVKIYGAVLDAAQVMDLYKQSRGSGNALLFKGNSTNHVLLPGSLNAPPAFFMEAWVKRNAVQPWQWLFSGTETNTWQWGLNGNTMVYGKVGGGSVVSYGINIDDNRWHHLAVTYDGTISEVRFYCDGVGEGTGNLSNTGIVAGTYSIGNRSGTTESLDGYMDELRIGDGARDINTIRNWMCRKPTTDGYSGLGFHFNFDEQTITAAYDVKGGSKSLLIDGPQYVTSGAPIGDISSHDFVSSLKAPSISIRPSETFTATETSGGLFGLSVYVVKDPPANQTGILGLGNNDYYAGVYCSYGTNPQYTATYDYTGNPFVSPVTEPTLQLFKRNDNSAAGWTNSGATLNTAANTLTVTGQNTEYILGSLGIALPVASLNLQARKINSTTVQLNWQTATEINNKGFEVQRSFDGNYYTDIQFVNGAGNSNDIKLYSVTDVPGRTGRVFYRLKQVDFDGNSKLSNIVSVVFDKQGIVKVYPNPAQQQVTVEGMESYSRLQLLDASGKLLREVYTNGQYQVGIDLNGLKNGIYFLRMLNGKESQTIKLIISN